MTEPVFLEPDAVIRLHDRALREYGGIQGLRSADLLHSALSRPRNRLAYSEAMTVDLTILAAAYAYGIASNHPFNDANKRTAWGSCVAFLKLNGVEIDVTPVAVVEAMVGLAARQISEDEFAGWLAAHHR